MAEDRRDIKEREAPDRSAWGDLQGSLKDKLGYRALGQREACSYIFLTTRSQCYLKNERFAFQHPAAGSSQETDDGTSDGYEHKFLGTRRVNR